MTSLFCVPYYALGAELSQDYHERTSVTGIRGVFALLGTLAAATLSFILFFPVLSQGIDPKLNKDGYCDMGLFGGLVMTLVGLISTFGTLSYRQNPAFPDVLPVGNSARSFFFNSLAALRNPSFRSIFISYSVFFLGTVINASLAIHFLTYYVKITASSALSFFQLFFYLGALAGAACLLKVSKRLEKRLLYFSGTLCTSMIMGCAFLLLGEGRILGVGNLKPLLLGHGLAGFFACILWIVPASMIADVADQDELLYGRRREGIFFGLFSFGEQLAGGASIFITGILIDRFACFVPGQEQQTAITITRIGMLYSLLPAALLAVAAFLVLRYSLNQKTVKVIQTQLHKNHSRG
jgi:Na+/melibiose symporter-like transporter